MIRRPPRSTRTDTLFPYTTRFRSEMAKMPRVEGSGAGQIYMAPETARLFEQAQDVAKKAGDSFVTVERLLQAIGLASGRSEEHTSELQSLMRISYAVFCLKKKKKHQTSSQNKKKT